VGIGLVFSYPIFIILFEILRGKNVKRHQVLIIFTGFLGLFFLLDLSTIDSTIGVLYGIISAVTLAILIIYGSEKSKKFGGLNVAFIQVLFAGVCLSPFTINGFTWMLDNLVVSLFLGFFLTGVGLATYWYVVKIITPLSIGTITYLEPVTGVIIGAMILNENLQTIQYMGFLLVISAGVVQVYLDSKYTSGSSA
jgi:drug/metabolite transporter (DMT)-like permease